MTELLLGLIPEALYFALFMILVKQINTKRILYIFLMIISYMLLKQVITFNIWFQICYMVYTYIVLKVLYKEKAQITDIFTFTIGSIILIIISAICFLICRPDMILGAIINRILLFGFLFLFRNKLYKIQKLYKKLWNRNDKVKKRIKSTTFRAINLIIFNLMFYIINLGILYAIFLYK